MAAAPARNIGNWWFAAVLIAALALWFAGKGTVPWAFDYPKAWMIPAMQWVGGFSKWLVDQAHFGLFTFKELTRFLAGLVDFPYRIVLSLLATGFLEGQGSAAVQIVPPLPWWAVTIIAALFGHWAGGRKLALFTTACFLFLAAFRQWDSAMVTLASILVAAPLGTIGGILLGVACYRWPLFQRLIAPVLDLMQTMPVFAYLVPVLVLFGFGPTAAIVATLIFAMPPMIRVTLLGLKGVPGEIHDLAAMVGCTQAQTMWRVLVPAARQSLMVGVNQVIMLSLNMVIIASMIGAGGLGFDVLTALRRLDFGAGIEAGFAIVVLALVLDRLSQAAADKLGAPQASTEGRSFVQRHPHGVAAAAVAVMAILLAYMAPVLQAYPQALSVSTGAFFSDVVAWINVNYFDALEGFKNFILLNILVPAKRLLFTVPWIGAVAVLAALGFKLGGWRLAVLAGTLVFLIAATGQWEKAMITVYLCGTAVVLATLIGVPVGVLAADRERLWRGVQAVIDTLQTLPSFVYLMPVVMLFRVGDFTALIAIVAFAVVPAIRYTVLGLQKVDPSLIEAGRAMGATPWQILSRIRLRLALPDILLGMNQTIMFALSMLVITALVGTRDLGQEVYIALTKADIGRGIVAGLAVAFIAIVSDRLIAGAAARQKAGLGLA
ncbi:MAG: ABC transporter permease subunit [Proteobacteria bacterium]|nr:ABC transporter permease subunit [Pseudomonadota bacterium]